MGVFNYEKKKSYTLKEMTLSNLTVALIWFVFNSDFNAQINARQEKVNSKRKNDMINNLAIISIEIVIHIG